MLRRLGRGRIAVNTVWAKLLDDAQLLDVAGNGSLRGRETGLVQLSEQLLLRLDAVVCDGIVAQNYADTYGFVIMEEPLVLEENSVIVATGNEELLAEVNNAIAQFKASDAYVDLQVKWGLTAAEIETTETEGTEESSEAEGAESTPEESSSSEAA